MLHEVLLLYYLCRKKITVKKVEREYDYKDRTEYKGIKQVMRELSVKRLIKGIDCRGCEYNNFGFTIRYKGCGREKMPINIVR